MLSQVPAIDSLWQDVRYAFRNIFRNPGFTSIVILCLALGIGANTTMFSVINAVLLRPLPFKGSDRLVGMLATPSPGLRGGLMNPSVAALDAVRSLSDQFEDVTGFGRSNPDLTGASEPQWVQSADVVDNFFSMLGMSALRGRTLQPGEGKPGHEFVAVISYPLWQHQFAGAEDVLGKTIFLDGKPYAIVGIMPKAFNFPRGADLWTPLPDSDLKDPHFRLGGISGRLRTGVTLEQAQAAISLIAPRLSQIDPKLYKGGALLVSSITAGRVQQYREALWLLFGAVGLVLLIACANVGNLFLARAWDRQKEFSIRASLGASRMRIARQLLVEAIVLALAGGAMGLALAVSALGIVRAIAPPDIPRIDELGVDRLVFLFNLAVSCVAGILFGMLPVRQLWKADLRGAISGAQPNTFAVSGVFGRVRFRDVLTICEVTLCLVLLVGSTLAMRSLFDLMEIDLGFHTDHILTMLIAPPANHYRTKEQLLSVMQQMVNQVRATPGVEAASAKINPFLTGDYLGGDFRVGALNGPRSDPSTHIRYVMSDYFKVLGLSSLAGRVFDPADDAVNLPVAIVNRSFANHYFAGHNPVGEHLIDMGWGGLPNVDRVVVGEVADARDTEPSEAPSPTVFVPFGQTRYSADIAFFLVRTAAPPLSFAKTVEQQIWRIDRDVPVQEVQTVDQIISDSLVEPKFHAALLGAFAGLGLVLALIGIFGVVSYSVGQRTREIGIRIALGAERSNILRLIIGGGMLPVLIGIAIGAAAALALTRLIASFLYGVKPTDPLSFIGAAAAFCAVALLACYHPARRATRVDPVVALRHD